MGFHSWLEATVSNKKKEKKKKTKKRKASFKNK